MIKNAASIGFFAALLLVGGAASAQQGIAVSAKPFEPNLPIAPAQYAPPKQLATVVTAPAVPQDSWDIQLKDINFANVFHRWAGKAGYRVRWDAQKHFLVEAPDSVTGSFEEALTAVLESPGIAQSAYPLEVCIYPNTPPLARITRKGEQDKECK